ncbi:JAB domain-containing protein [uncultured Brachyspira sp.]|uniref:JAB domain-containing protein n=1 Tax=uncultured Brachyspira sp. TaxID=221953 RepID=UPI0026043E08|nr:JAB domain-containing protein [uncultured Brachyspira sp.]
MFINDNFIFDSNIESISLEKEKEIVSYLISNGISQNRANIITDKLYYKFHNLYNIVNSDEKELLKIKGITSKKIFILKNIPILLEYYLNNSLKSDILEFKKKDLINYLIIKLGRLKFETFSIICLDINKRFISIEQIFRGTIDSATIYPRDLVEKALSLGSSYVILSHNHPSGIAKPSNADIEITEIIYKAFFMVNIKVIDHIIIAGNLHYSFRENGILDKYKDSIKVGV